MTNRSLNSEPCGAIARSSGGFLNGILQDKDTALVLALIILLYSDNCDRLLLLALVYIIS